MGSTLGTGSSLRVRWSSESTLLRAQVEGKDLPALLMLYSSQVRRWAIYADMYLDIYREIDG